jgi:hypothetical protein
MTYTIRVKDGDSWLTLLDEAGEVRQFERLALAAIEAKRLIEEEGATVVRIYLGGIISSTLLKGSDGNVNSI